MMDEFSNRHMCARSAKTLLFFVLRNPPLFLHMLILLLLDIFKLLEHGGLNGCLLLLLPPCSVGVVLPIVHIVLVLHGEFVVEVVQIRKAR